ncbi:hypothetical protein Moror_9833 [Moniliophthora roreri MCA 2997]|uniref:Uncharacterized protein n=1 Tax=Moniliophthora roreri (strain MCA 2997) TaxID=1381753 RepID=V2WI31_MONRO|nr:hypothetical protein Moror_9833 [Moniliophthora roreri MCA 2997]
MSSRSVSSRTTAATSLVTLTGPGALAGKAIYMLGKATLKGVDRIIIYRRLSAISSRFPHKNSAEIRGIQQAYYDLLELSRPIIYSKSIRDQALGMLLGQIGSRQSRYLLHSLLTWPEVEIGLLMSDIMMRFDPLRVPPLSDDTYLRDPIVNAYRIHVSDHEDHSLLPLIDFLEQMVSISDGSCVTILERGALDFMLHLYLTGFRDPAPSQGRTNTFGATAFLLACNSFLVLALQSTLGAELFRRHRVSRIWPPHPALDLHGSREAWSTRQQFWRDAERVLLKWRISSIHELMLDTTKEFNKQTALDALIDCFELIQPQFSEDITYRALRSLHQAIVQGRSNNPVGRSTVVMAMKTYFSGSSEMHMVETLNRIIDMAEALLLKHPAPTRFFSFEDDRPSFILNSVVHLIHLVAFLFERYADERNAMSTIGIIPLVEQALGILESSRVADDSVFFYNISDKSRDIELYSTIYGFHSLNAPIHIHVLRWSLILLKDPNQGGPPPTFSNLPDSWWDPEHDRNIDLYGWINNE